MGTGTIVKPDNKELTRLFASHMHGRVINRHKPHLTYIICGVKGSIIYVSHQNDEVILQTDAQLLLKSLTSISDEDAVTVGKLKLGMGMSETVGYMRSIFKEPGYCFTLHWFKDYKIIDFLRSRGYALPYLKWSVGDLVEAGVYKLDTVVSF